MTSRGLSPRPTNRRTSGSTSMVMSSATFPPDWLRAIWPFAFDNRQNLQLVPPEPGTPKGWVAIKVEYPQIQNLYYADPAHGYAVARIVEWSSHNNGRMKFRTELKALHWAQLPGGGWYVKTWERLNHLDKFDAAGKPEAVQQPDYTTFRRIAITPMDPDKFPPGILRRREIPRRGSEGGGADQGRLSIAPCSRQRNRT